MPIMGGIMQNKGFEPAIPLKGGFRNNSEQGQNRAYVSDEEYRKKFGLTYEAFADEFKKKLEEK